MSPTVGNFTSGTVEFARANGTTISAIPQQSFGSNGTLDLTSLNLQTHSELSRMHVSLAGTSTSAISVKMTWTAEWHPECIVSGQTASTTNVPPVVPPVFVPPVTTTAPTTAPSTTSPTTTVPLFPVPAPDTVTLPVTGADDSRTMEWAIWLSVAGALTIAVGRRGRTTRR